MNYFEFLNQYIANDQNLQYSSQIKLDENTKYKPVLTTDPQLGANQEVRTVNMDGVSIFNSASKEDVEAVNYDNILNHSDESDKEPVKLSPLEWVLNKFFGFEEVSEAADINGDGKISEDEARKYVAELMKKDGNIEELSLDDFTALLEEYGINLEERLPVDETSSVFGLNTVSEFSSFTFNPTYAPVFTYNAPINKSVKSNNSFKISGSIPNRSKTIDEMTLDELNTEKDKRVENLNEKITDLKNVQSGNTDAIKASKENEAEAKTAYENALDKDELLKQYKEGIKTNIHQLEENRNKVGECKNNILDKEVEISNQEQVYNSAVSNLKALKDALSTLSVKRGTLKDEAKEAELEAKIKDVQNKIAEQEKIVAAEESKLETVKKELEELNILLKTLETQGEALQKQKEALDKLVDDRASEVTKAAKNAYNEASAKVREVADKEMEAAKAAYDEASKSVDEINERIKIAESAKIKAQNSFNDARAIYDEMNLEAQGLNWEVFEMAMEGYKNLPENQKVTGKLGIFDTTQSADKERYYLIDLNTHQVIGRTVMKTGSGAYMSDVRKANQQGSHSTLSGFEKIGSEYYSGKMGKQALNIYGLEEGINDNAYNKRTVVHYASGNKTWGCKGFAPVRNRDGSVDVAATNAKMHELFPQGTIMYTHPTDPNYKKISKLYEVA